MPVLVEGGVLEGRQVRAFGLNVTLPSAPAALARNGEVLYAGYPFQLLIYRRGVVESSVQLPGIPRYIKAKPLPLVGLENGLFVPGQGLLSYPARDALNTRQGIYWLDNDGVNLERRRVVEGSFGLMAASDQAVYAFGREGVRVSDGLRFPLPRPATAAVVQGDVYVASAQGIVRLNPDGLRLGSVDGVFSGLESDGTRLYSLRDGRLVTISLDLRLVEVAGTRNTLPPSFAAVRTTPPVLPLAAAPLRGLPLTSLSSPLSSPLSSSHSLRPSPGGTQ
ncbi:MAG: hypothetical protein SFU83_23775 [Meiothermus sp.]|nr:hypothetical protein [Meiothermus sp.]